MSVTPIQSQTSDRFEGICPEELSDLEKETLVNLALVVLAPKRLSSDLLSTPDISRRYLQLSLAGCKNEVFGCFFLDNHHRLIAEEKLFFGTIDGASVHPRVVVQRTLELNAAALILWHNHPSGVAEPSQSDQQITNRLKDALALVDVRVLDHLVVGSETTTSFAELGLL
ncbi:MAG: DNA repair protein RadC [gamma proteobacterium endosymbiont of Lamellibrachia anaximandri]|nr:DNA repair protein RadC [gamma proteobacterium endosymbiont of Lamellibrachia anaximandri]